jgi:ketosteroid isomerase-like protein
MDSITNAPKSVPQKHIDPIHFAAEAERVTNNGRIDELLALYAPDAVAEWIMDGAYDRHDGIAAIRTSATELFAVCTRLRLRVRKTVVCAEPNTVVITWTGGFGGADRQSGIEIWTFRDGLVVRHQMYSYLDVRASNSPIARFRLLLTSPKVLIASVAYRLGRLRNAPRRNHHHPQSTAATPPSSRG